MICKGDLDKESINEFLADKVAKWWLPDDIIKVENYLMEQLVNY